MILWLDDDIDLALQAYLDELSDLGYTVKRFRDPDRMWDYLEGSPPPQLDAIIMDILLPTGERLDPATVQEQLGVGIAQLELLLKHPSTTHLPMFILTIRRSKDIQDWADKKGIAVHFKTDGMPDEFARTVDAKIKLSRE